MPFTASEITRLLRALEGIDASLRTIARTHRPAPVAASAAAPPARERLVTIEECGVKGGDPHYTCTACGSPLTHLHRPECPRVAPVGPVRSPDDEALRGPIVTEQHCVEGQDGFRCRGCSVVLGYRHHGLCRYHAYRQVPAS